MVTAIVSGAAIALAGLQSPLASRAPASSPVLKPVSGAVKIAAAKAVVKVGGNFMGGIVDSLTLTVRAPHQMGTAYLDFAGISSYSPNEGPFGAASGVPMSIGGGGFAPAVKICGIGVNCNIVRVGKPHVITLYFQSGNAQTISVMGAFMTKMGTLAAKQGQQTATFAFVPDAPGWKGIAFLFKSEFKFFTAEIDVVQ